MSIFSEDELIESSLNELLQLYEGKFNIDSLDDSSGDDSVPESKADSDDSMGNTNDDISKSNGEDTADGGVADDLGTNPADTGDVFDDGTGTLDTDETDPNSIENAQDNDNIKKYDAYTELFELNKKMTTIQNIAQLTINSESDLFERINALNTKFNRFYDLYTSYSEVNSKNIIKAFKEKMIEILDEINANKKDKAKEV